MSELYRYKDGTVERRYTRGEARWVYMGRFTIALITLPFILVVRMLVEDFDEVMRPFGHASIRLIGGESYP